MLQDLKYAIRGIVKRPAFAALVIATLALGIGANTAMFTIVHSVLVKPLPYDSPDQLVYMTGSFKLSDQASVSPPDYLDYRDRNSVFSSLAARTILGSAVITGNNEPERVRMSYASANFFSTLGIKPYRGRAFLPTEENGESDLAIISYGLWQRRYLAVGAQQTTGPMPGVSLGPTTAAPAPSAKMNAVPRSVESVMSESLSTPITRTWPAPPPRTIWSASASPWQKPAQAAEMSKAAAWLVPSS